MQTDWKDLLANIKDDMPIQPDETPEMTETPEAPATKKDVLRVVLDRKGRKGKTATIVEGFTVSDAEVEAIASDLKRSIGTGGSARGGEILLQGDWRDRAAALLRARGFAVKK